ncbi:hypothetical protein GLYMA_09G050733v4 [Glycine max]|nr:hypothetical protein GLYMA_09G050733v4 [Glycine max]KAH1041547.1 hypothetical protein GYH30_024084 [Glycine max]
MSVMILLLLLKSRPGTGIKNVCFYCIHGFRFKSGHLCGVYVRFLISQ